MCTHICAAGPLILSGHPPVKRRESTAGVPSAKFRALNAEQRAKETRCAPAKRQEFTAAVPSNFALVRLGQHQLALGHSFVTSLIKIQKKKGNYFMLSEGEKKEKEERKRGKERRKGGEGKRKKERENMQIV